MRRIAVLIFASVLVLHTVPAFAAGKVAVAAKAQAAQGQQLGTLQCTARSSTGQPLANFTVRLRNVTTGQLAGSTTTDQDGSCRFIALPPATYVFEMVNAAGQIVGTSAAVTVAAGATVAVTITASAAAALTAGAAGGAAAAAAGGGAAATTVSTALAITTFAGAATIAGIAIAQDQTQASPSR